MAELSIALLPLAFVVRNKVENGVFHLDNVMCDLSNDGGVLSPLGIECGGLFSVLCSSCSMGTFDESIPVHLKASMRHLEFLKDVLIPFLFA